MGVLLILLGLVFAGLVPFAAARVAHPPGARRRARRRAASRRAVRARLDAVHRPHLRRDPRPLLHQATAARGAVLVGGLRLGLGLPFVLAGLVLPARARRAVVGAPPPAGRDAGRRRDARRRRRAAGHRLVGPGPCSGCRCGWSAASRWPYDGAPAPRDRPTARRAAAGAASWTPASSAAGRGGSSPRCAPRCVLLLLLALAAVPGSVIPQEGVDSLATSRWKDAHPDLTPVYERLGLFSVYDSAWFSAIYLLLVLSLVGCIVPRTFHYLRAHARPAAAHPAPPLAAARPRVVQPPTTTSTPCSARAREVLRPSAPAAGRRRRRLGERRAGPAARGRQPGVPPVGARGAGRRSPSAGCSATRAA